METRKANKRQSTLVEFSGQKKKNRQAVESAKPLPLQSERNAHRFFWDAASVKASGLEPEQLMKKLVRELAPAARPPISKFYVASALLGVSGNVYVGVNLEFPGVGLELTCHAEEAVISFAVQHGETGIRRLVVNAPPCGFCRQILAETGSADSLIIHVLGNEDRPDFECSLNELLPMKFGPSDLGIKNGLLSQGPSHRLALGKHPKSTAKLLSAALRAASKSYCPYTDNASGVALETSTGRVVVGSYVENAAFNPSIPPWKSAMLALTETGEPFSSIRRAALVEVECQISHESSLRAVIGAVAPDATIIVNKARHLADACGGVLHDHADDHP